VREKTLGVVDIGSNTVHLLVARTDGRHVEPLVDISDGLRLGSDINDTGYLSDDKLNALVDTLIAFRDEALLHAPQGIHLLATQAIRTANNRDHILRVVRFRVNLPMDVLTPEQEAEYSFLGAGLACPSVGLQAMVDIGGGSMQVALGHDGHADRSVSLPLGAARVTHQFLQSDPPTYLQEAALVNHLAEVIPPALPIAGAPVTGLLGVGGTLRRTPALLRLQLGDVYPPGALEQMLALVRGRRSDDIASMFELKPERARLLLPALLLVREVSRGYDNPPLIMSPYGVREGAIVMLARSRQGGIVK
jgi:exopolyphosphatase/guanosine-5'-triphosphate,3'-diphosphate pyrophosphatase